MKKEIGKYLLDVSKLIFGGAVLFGIMKEEISLTYIVPVGLVAASSMAVWGFLLIKQSK